jgi:hypothetical protein
MISLELRVHGDDHRGMHANGVIDKNDTVVEVPLDMLMTAFTAMVSDIGN